MYKPLREYRVKQARLHKEWYETTVKDKSKIRFFPLRTDWIEAAKTMTIAERKFYRVQIEKSRLVRQFVDDMLAIMERRSQHGE